MKKNRMMRIAAVLLVAVLLTTSVISGTFAKYTTAVTASDEARVAAWGFGESTTLEFDLFSTNYDDTAVSSGTDNIIAPGTEQSETIRFEYADTTGKGAPEVDYTVKLEVVANETNIGDAIKGNTSITWVFNGTEYGTWDTMIAAINAYTEDVEANALPALETTGVTIGWKWAYEGNDTGDTAMGNATALETVKLTVKMTATQDD